MNQPQNQMLLEGDIILDGDLTVISWFILALIFAILLAFIGLGKSAADEDLEILILRQHLNILARKRQKPIKPARTEEAILMSRDRIDAGYRTGLLLEAPVNAQTYHEDRRQPIRDTSAAGAAAPEAYPASVTYPLDHTISPRIGF